LFGIALIGAASEGLMLLVIDMAAMKIRIVVVYQ